MIGIIDYGCGNTYAFINAFKLLNISARVVSTAAEIEDANKIIMPGVGSFDHVMNRFNESGLRNVVEHKVLVDKIDILGVCAGMQILTESSDEGIEKGLGWLKGKIKLFNIDKISYKTKIPHMGWNTIVTSKSPLFEGIKKKSRFYFVHSYYFDNYHNEDRIAITNYGENFTSAVNKNNIYGVQFHPEKSHQNGLRVLENFANI